MQYKEELINLILNPEQLDILLSKAAEIIDVINQSDDLSIIQQALTLPENYAILKQVASISDYLDQIAECVVWDFIEYVLKKKADELSISEQDYLQKTLLALHLMHYLYQSNKELYEVFSQLKSDSNKTNFDVVFEQKNDEKIEKITYQFLFDPQKNVWLLKQYFPGVPEGKMVEDRYVLGCVEDSLRHMTPTTLNPFIKKSLFSPLQYCTERHEEKQRKRFFRHQSDGLYPQIKKDYECVSQGMLIFSKLNIIHTVYFNNAKDKPMLMARLLLVDGLFELRNTFKLISYLSYHVKWSLIEDLLEKEPIKKAFLDADTLGLYDIEENCKDLKKLSEFYFEHASLDQTENLKGHLLYSLVLLLSKDDFIKYRNQGKIRLEYPRHCQSLEKLYDAYPTEFQTVLEDMITSGNMINEIPSKEEILNHYLNLFFKHDGAWFNLIRDRENRYSNHKADLLNLAMKTDPQKTVAIIKAMAQEDSQGNQYLPIALDAKEIATLISQSPKACVLLDYDNILETLRQDMFSFEPYGKIRQFDLLYKIIQDIPAIYGEKLLRSGLLFAEKGMPHFQHLSGLGDFGGKNPSDYIHCNFGLLYTALPVPTFMSALAEGLTHNLNVNRLFLKDIFEINLLALAVVLQKFQTIKHLEIALDLNEQNQLNIIKFFALLRETNPGLNYHVQIALGNNKEHLIFLKNYLSQHDDQIITLTIIPGNFWIKSLLNEDASFKQFFDDCIKEICQNTYSLRQINMDEFSKKSIFRMDDDPTYQFEQLPSYSTQLFAIGSPENIVSETEKRLLRNRNIYALNVISSELRHLQNVLELLVWFTMYGLPAEIVLDIFDRLKYQHELPTNLSPYISILNAIKKSRSQQAENNDSPLARIAHKVEELETFVKSTTMQAYYRYKPYKKNINDLETFLNLNKLQEEVVGVITDWFCSDEYLPKLLGELKCIGLINQGLSLETTNGFLLQTEQQLFVEKIFSLMSQSPFILALDGIPLEASCQTMESFSELNNKLNLYQKAVSHSLKLLQREAFVDLQCYGPLSNFLQWKDLSSQLYDGVEFLNVLEKYDADKDLPMGSSFLMSCQNIVHSIFSKESTKLIHFSSEENMLFGNIVLALQKYLLQKAKRKDQQCDRHKHMHKNTLFNLLAPEKIAIFKDSNPRLFLILQIQRERLAASLSKCSVKLMLRHSGLFSSSHQVKKVLDAPIISDYEKQITAFVTQPH